MKLLLDMPWRRRLFQAGLGIFAATLLLLAVAFDPRPGGEFRSVKELIAGVGILLGFSLLLASGRLRKELGLVTPLLAALGLLFGVGTVHALLSEPSTKSALALFNIGLAALALFGWSTALTREELGRLILWWLWGSLASVGVALLQLFDTLPVLRFATLAGVGKRYEVTGLAGNPGDLAYSLVLAVLITGAFFLRTGLRRYLLAAGLALTGILISGTVAALAAVALAMMAGAWVAIRDRLPVFRYSVGVALALSCGVLLVPSGSGRVMEKMSQLMRGDWNAALSGRLDGWQVAWELARQHPWSGVGLGAYGSEFVEVKSRLVEAGAGFYPDQFYPVFENAHSDPLELLAELGWLLGSLVLVGLGLGVARFLGKSWAGWEPVDRGLGVALVIALALLAMFGFPFRIAAIVMPALLVVAWLSAPSGSGASQKAAWAQGSGPWRLGLAAALAVSSLMLAWSGLRRINAVRSLSELESKTAEMAREGRVDPRMVFQNLKEIEALADRLPGHVSVRLARASQFFLLGRHERALRLYDEAQLLERRPEIHFNLALVLEQLGCIAAAKLERQWAAYLDPAIARKMGLDPRALPLPPPMLFASDFECGYRGWAGPILGSEEN